MKFATKAKKILMWTLIAILVIVIAGLYSYGSWDTNIYSQNAENREFVRVEGLNGYFEISQSFVCPVNGFSGIKIRCEQAFAKTDVINWVLRDEDDAVIEKGEIDLGSFDVKEFQKKKFLPIALSKTITGKGRTFKLILSGNEFNEGSITIFMGDKNKIAGELIVKEGIGDLAGQIYEDNGLVLKISSLRFNIETFVTFLGISLYIIFFIRFMMKLFR
jgi:hypothetical protein